MVKLGALAGSALWTAGKVAYAVQDRLGLPGLPDPGTDAGGAQWGNVALGVVCVVLCLLLLVDLPRRARAALLLVSGVAVVMVGLGAVTALLVLVGVVAPAGPGPVLWLHVLVVLALLAWVALWGLAVAQAARAGGHHEQGESQDGRLGTRRRQQG